MANDSPTDPTVRKRRGRRPVAIALILMLVTASIAATVYFGPALKAWWHCRPNLFASDVWSAAYSLNNRPQGEECVGISDGSYTFDRPEMKVAFDALEAQNRQVDAATCKGAPVTVGVPLTLSSPNAVGRARHEIEGFVATQAAANDYPLCTHPIKLRIGQTGSAQEAATPVMLRLADSRVVAMVGMGLSDVATADAVNAVSAPDRTNPVPMVADLVSAEGFDTTGSASDFPKFDDCDHNGSYKQGIGRGWFYRVGFRNTVQARTVASYNAGAPVGFLIKPMLRSDPATCTQLAEYRSQFGKPLELAFTSEDPTNTLQQAVRRICGAQGHVRIVYGGRSLDLAIFLVTLDQFYENGWCSPDDVTVLAGSDSSRMRAEDPDVKREQQRLMALRAKNFQNGRIRLVQTPLADPDLPAIAMSKGYKDLTTQFTRLGFDTADLDDGWAVNAHDALRTVVEAVNAFPPDNLPSPDAVNAAITNTFAGDDSTHPASSVRDAIVQPLTFDPSGNRTGEPPVVRLCPVPDDQTPHPRTRTVVLRTGEIGNC